MFRKATPLACLTLSLLLLQTSCLSLRKKSNDDYAYLRKKVVTTPPTGPVEPYEVVDIAILDTATAPTQSDHPILPPEVTTPLPTDLPTTAILTVLQVAKSYMGTPYQYGGTSKTGIDCSGLVFSSFLSIEMTLPRTSRALAEAGEPIKPKKIKEGDLVFFSSRNDGNINHVGLVTAVAGAEVSFIHATVSKGVREDRLDVGYWSERFIKAVRVS